jgi:hypothetical protein
LIEEHCRFFQKAAEAVAVVRVPSRLRRKPEAALPIFKKVPVRHVRETPSHLEDAWLPFGIVRREFHADRNRGRNPAFCHEGDSPGEKDALSRIVDTVREAGEHFGDTRPVLSQADTTIPLVPGIMHLAHTGALGQRFWHAPISRR